MPRNGRDLSEAELKMWKGRLRHADEVWKDAGLHDDSAPGTSAVTLFDYYRGDQADGIGFKGLAASGGVIDNVFFSTINALVAALYARNPRTDVVADDPNKKPNAEKMERAVNHLVASPRLRIKREVNRTLLDALLMQFGVMRHGFTLGEEKHDKDGNLLEIYDPVRPEFPWIQRQGPWDFRCDPLGATLHPEHARWCMFRDLETMETISKSPAYIRRKSLVATRSLTDARFRKHERWDADDESSDLVECWRVYDKVKRETFVLSPGCPDAAISPVKPWPIPWRTLPYNILQFNPVPDDPMGTAYGRQIKPLQDDLNRAYTLALELAKRQRRIIFVDENLGTEEKEKLDALSLMEIVFCQNTTTVMKEVMVGGNFQELLLLAQTIKDEIRALVGVGDMERGQRINVETAAEASQVGQGSALQRGRNQGPFEDFLADTIETFARGVQATATQPLIVPILGAESTADLFKSAGDTGITYDEIPAEAIQGEFTYRIRPGSTLPYNPGEELAKEIGLNAALIPFGEIINMPQRAVDTILAAEKDPSRQLLNGPQLMALIENQALAPPPTEGAGGKKPGQPSGAVTPQTGVDPQILDFVRPRPAAGGAQ